MPWGRYPDQVKGFRKWAADQVDRGSVAGNKVTSSRHRNKLWRKKRRKRRRKNGSKD